MLPLSISPDHFEAIRHLFPTPRGYKLPAQTVFSAWYYVVEKGIPWCALPPEYGNYKTIYQRVRRWVKMGVPEALWRHVTRLGLEAHREYNRRVGLPDVINMDSTHIKTHPKAVGRREGQPPQAIGRTKGGLNTKLHAVTAGTHLALSLELSPGNVGDNPVGQTMIKHLDITKTPGQDVFVNADKAYDSDKTRALIEDKGMKSNIPPRKNRTQSVVYNKTIYGARNATERFFRRVKECRGVCTRYARLDAMFLGGVFVACVVEGFKLLANLGAGTMA